ADLAHEVGHAPDGLHHFGHRGPGLVHQLAALLHAFHAGVDQDLDLLGRVGAALREAAHFRGHHREAAALVAGPRRFHGGVERQDVGLEGDAVDHADDVGDAARALVDALHRLDDV